MIDGTLLAAASMGFLGSIHCAAMCGPLALTGACKNGALVPRDAAGYFLGRLAAYTFGGAMFGALGHSVHEAVLRFQNVALLLIAGVCFAYGAVLVRRSRRRAEPGLVTLPRGPSRRRSGVLAFAAGLVPRRGLGLGLATGVLPCGLLMGGWMLAVSTGNPLEGAGVMLTFSLATLPGLAAPLLARNALRGAIARLPGSTHGLAWCALAVWIGLRPLLMSGHVHGTH